MKRKIVFYCFYMLIAGFLISCEESEGPQGPPGPEGPAGTGSGVCTYISQDTTWAISESPKVMNSTVIVESGATLTIEPGVCVLFNPNTGLLIEGGLIADGNSANHIEFKSRVDGDQYSLRLIGPNVASSSSISYASIIDGHLWVKSTSASNVISPTFLHCDFVQTEIDISGYSNPTFTYCTINHNHDGQWYIVRLLDGTNTTFSYCLISVDIRVGEYSSPPSTGTVTINNCDLSADTGNDSLRLNSTVNADATNCWWGTTNTTDIENMIREVSTGVVNYTPILLGPSVGAGCGW